MFDFKSFAASVARRFTHLSKFELYRTGITGDELWAMYLAAFPAGTNPIYRVRTHHDGSYDRNFIRQLGNVVAITDGEIQTLWGIAGLDHPYAEVSEVLNDAVRNAPIVSLFRTQEPTYGYEHTIEKLEGGGTHRWHHFHAPIAKKHLVARGKVGEAVGAFDTRVQLFERGLQTLRVEDINAVLDLIEAGTLYRGDEHKDRLRAFRTLIGFYNTYDDARKNMFVWQNAAELRLDISQIRNNVIGTLLVDLAEGKDLEYAVKGYESKVAPANYRRPTALITQRMVDDAAKALKDMGLEDAIPRRMARLEDVSVNDVLWVNNSAAGKMKDGIAGLLAGEVKTPTVSKAAAEEIDVIKFVDDILPRAINLELLFQNRLQPNLMVVTAPVHADAPSLFRWDNGFGWSYNGNIADSEMRRAVQAKGGRVDGVFRFTHQWNYAKRNASLMDLHVFMPGNTRRKAGAGSHNGYGNGERVGWNHRSHSASGGVQDVDYTSPAPVGYVPVENITFPNIERMPEGVYTCAIHNWQQRSPNEGGFKAEIEFDGQIFEYEYLKPLKGGEWVDVAKVTLKNKQFTIEHLLPHGAASVDVWGLKTETFVKVNTLIKSPNHWDGQANGNKHWFFIVDGCRTEELMRGIYNEFLKPELDKHRKVFEVLGNKTKCEPTSDQLSGLGFSSTKQDSVIVRVSGDKINKTYKINFGAPA